jgi:tetratricopeptide (TPR) repeat protein
MRVALARTSAESIFSGGFCFFAIPLKFFTMKYAVNKKLSVFVLLLSLVVVAQAQKSKKGPEPDCQLQTNEILDKSYKAMYADGLRYGDLAVASNAVYGLLSIHPDSTALLDTLAALYFQRGAWPQVVLVTTDILMKNDKNEGALELRAVANQSLGRAKESLEDYEKLFGRNNNPYHLYEIAALQFAMKRFGECERSVQQLLTDQSIKDKTIVISLQDGRSQDVPLAAAGMNLLGVMSMEQGKKENAKTAFESALKVFPEFILAKNNLEALETAK